MIGVAPQQVAECETGENALAASRLFLVAGALGADVATFLDGLDTSLGPALTRGGPDGPDSAARSPMAARGALEMAEIARTISNRQTRDLPLVLSRAVS